MGLISAIGSWFASAPKPSGQGKRDRQPREYVLLLARLQEHVRPSNYVEIGVRYGKSLELARWSRHKIGIDPQPLLEKPDPTAQIFAQTSDDFFAQHDLGQQLSGAPVAMAFIDGMHLFEYALRDFMNLERYSDQHTVILVHDCYPRDAQTASRDRQTAGWTGDVWKLVLCLREHRPELRLAVVDAAPSGLAIIRGLDNGSRVLSANYEDILAKYVPMNFEQIAAEKSIRLGRVANDWALIEPMLRPGRLAA